MMHACASAQTMVPTMSPPCFLHKNSTIKDLLQTCLGSYAGVIFTYLICQAGKFSQSLRLYSNAADALGYGKGTDLRSSS